MGILEQYQQQQQPHMVAERPERQSADSSAFLVWLVMRLLGGRIRERKQVNLVLLGFCALVTVVSVLLIVLGNPHVRSSYAPVPVIDRELEDINWPPANP